MRFEEILSSSLLILLLETPFLGCGVCAFQFCRVSERSATRGGVHTTLMSMPPSGWPSAQCQCVKYQKCGSFCSGFYRRERDGMEYEETSVIFQLIIHTGNRFQRRKSWLCRNQEHYSNYSGRVMIYKMFILAAPVELHL